MVLIAVGIGCVWAVLVNILGARLVWAGPLVGVAVGLLVRRVPFYPSFQSARFALALTFVVLLFSRVLASQLSGYYVSTREVANDRELVYQAVLVSLGQDGGLADQGAEPYLTHHDLVMKRIAELSPSEKRGLVQDYIYSAQTPVLRDHSPQALFRLWDVFWWSIALVIAYALGLLPRLFF